MCGLMWPYLDASYQFSAPANKDKLGKPRGWWLLQESSDLFCGCVAVVCEFKTCK